MKSLAHVCTIVPGWFDDELVLEDSEKFIKHLTKFGETFLKTRCFFKNFGSECNQLFSKSIMPEGLCYTFNGLNGKEIFREEK